MGGQSGLAMPLIMNQANQPLRLVHLFSLAGVLNLRGGKTWSISKAALGSGFPVLYLGPRPHTQNHMAA